MNMNMNTNSDRMDKITEAIGKINSEYIEEVSAEREAETLRLEKERQTRKGRLIKLAAAAVACAALAITLWAVKAAKLPIEDDKNSSAPNSTSTPANGEAPNDQPTNPSGNPDKNNTSEDKSAENTPSNPANLSAVKPLAEVSYPSRLEYPDFDTSYYNDNDKYSAYHKLLSNWEAENIERRASPKEITVSRNFYKDTIQAILSANNRKDVNTVYSPMSLYLALSMLAECADGDSRQEILDLLDVKSIGSLRDSVSILWESNYRFDKTTQSMLASSIWIDKSFSFKKDTVATLAKDYYAEAFRETLSDAETKEKIAAWLNSKTGGLLEEAVNKIKEPDEPGNSPAFIIYSTLYFKGRWDQEFQPQKTEDRTFHSPEGDVTVPFMYQSMEYGPYYYGEDYSAVCLRFKQGGNMWFILPDEDKSIEQVLESGEYIEMIAKDKGYAPGFNWKKQKEMIVELYMPKFDVSSDITLSESLMDLGVESVFSPFKADFTPLTNDEVYLERVRQAARVTIDEEGCTAAAFTEEILCGAAMPPEEIIEMVFDRPFIYVIQSDTDEILFAGTVYNPS